MSANRILIFLKLLSLCISNMTVVEDSSELIEIRLFGDGINPESLSSRDLADLITGFENTIIYTLAEKNPEINPEYAFISLTNIKPGSARLQFKPTLVPEILSAYLLVIIAMKSGMYENLPSKSVDSLIDVSKFLKKKRCNAEFHYNKSDSVEHQSAVLSPETVIELPACFKIKGETTLYGKVLRTGGKDPRAQIELNSEEILYCKVDEKQAQKLGKFLYKQIRMKGIATWNKLDDTICNFEIKEVEEFQQQSLADRFKKISELFGSHFEDIDNPNEYIEDLRKN